MTSLPAQVVLSALRPTRTLRYGPDRSQVADLHVPRGRGPFPVAVVLHGGYWQTRFGKLVCRPLALDLVRRGWAVWNLEYRRLGEGRGGGGGWPMTFDDVAGGVDALVGLGELRLDLDRVHLVGHSAGGQLALWAAARRDARVGVRSVVGLAPVTDLGRAGVHARALLGGRPEDVPERWAVADPSRAGAPPVPVLVVHPEGDATIAVERSREWVSRTRATGADVELVDLPGEGHRDVIDPRSASWAAAAGWLEARR